MLQNLVIQSVEHLFFCIYREHEHSNINRCDNKVCARCKKIIEHKNKIVFSKRYGVFITKADRSNRVDANSRNGKLESYHLDCWRELVFK